MRCLLIRLLPLLSLWASLVITGCNPQPPPPAELGAKNNPETTGHQRMVRLLAEYAETARRENRYYGDSLARDYNRQLEQLAASAPLQTRWKLCRLAGVAELRAGNEEKGIRLLEAAYNLLPKVSSRIGLEYAAETIFRLGVGHMRRGETLNCCARFTPESCILPIRGGGIHTDQEGSRQAIKYFARVLELLPPESDISMASRWLLNIAYMTLDGHPGQVPRPYLIPEEVFRSKTAFPRFENVASRLGLDRFNCSGGVVIDDFNNVFIEFQLGVLEVEFCFFNVVLERICLEERLGVPDEVAIVVTQVFVTIRFRLCVTVDPVVQ